MAESSISTSAMSNPPCESLSTLPLDWVQDSEVDRTQLLTGTHAALSTQRNLADGRSLFLAISAALPGVAALAAARAGRTPLPSRLTRGGTLTSQQAQTLDDFRDSITAALTSGAQESNNVETFVTSPETGNTVLRVSQWDLPAPFWDAWLDKIIARAEINERESDTLGDGIASPQKEVRAKFKAALSKVVQGRAVKSAAGLAGDAVQLAIAMESLDTFVDQLFFLSEDMEAAFPALFIKKDSVTPDTEQASAATDNQSNLATAA